MNTSFFLTHPFVTVAVGLDRHTLPLATLGAEIAQRLGKRLCLLHVLDSWDGVLKDSDAARHSPLWDVMPAIETSSRELAGRRLEEIRSSLPPAIRTEVVLTTGATAAAIGREAAGIGTALLLVGANYGAARFTPTGLSTSLSLLANSPVPVMAVDTSLAVPSFRKHTKILLADDLAEQSEAAVEFAAALSDSAPGCWVHHVHVSALSPENLRTALEGAAAAAYTSLPEGEIDAVATAVRQDRLRRLERRFDNYREYMEAAGGQYTAEVLPGSVKQELDLLIKDFAPDVLIFGRHREIHTQTFSFGRMPFRAMLSLRRPVIVVPQPGS